MSIKLLELRKEKNISQEEIAKKLGVTRQAYSRYERNEHELGYEALNTLADFFDVSIDYLLGHSTYFYPDQVTNNTLSPEEQKLIEDYRGLAQPLKDMLQSLIKTWQGEATEISPRRKNK